MIEAMAVIKAPQTTEDQKEMAWEDFEMLIQQIDNASSTFKKTSTGELWICFFL